MKGMKIIIAPLVMVFAMTAIAFGWGESSPTAIGMGGAYTALARHHEAPYWNPANMGLSDTKGFSISIINAGFGLRNNSFSLADYNKYTGKFLTDGDKNDIISSIPSEGLALDVLAEASALNFSVGRFAVTYKAFGASKVSLDRDPIELFLYGNAVMREVSLSSTRGEGYGIADAAVSYGRPVIAFEKGEMAVGASLHYLRGIAYQKIIESQGGIVTTDTGFVGSGNMTLRSALGGSGFAVDMGLAVRFEENWFFSAVWQNTYSKLIWNKDPEITEFAFDMQPITVESASDSAASDSLVTSSDTTYATDSFSSDLQPVVKLGIARQYSKLTWSVDWSQALAPRPGLGLNPRLAAGVEYRPIKQLPLRAGMAMGGNQGAIYSFGFGAHFGPFNFDLGMSNSGSPIPSHTKGAQLSVGMGLYF